MDSMMDILAKVCEYCGYYNWFGIDEDTNKVYCLQCGHYVENNIYVEEGE